MEAYAGFGSLMPLVTLPRETKESREVDEPIDPWLAPRGLEEHQLDLGANVVVAQDTPKYAKGPDYDEATAAKTFSRLLGDSEAEVRCVAVQRLVRVANRLSQQITLNTILPAVEERAASDDSSFVKVTLARHVGYLSRLLSKEQVTKQLLPIMLKQLEDKDADVRVTLLNASEEVIRATGA